MSDSESHRSASLSRDIIHRASRTDEVLNDHRNQPASLPIRMAPNISSDEDEYAVESDENQALEITPSSKRFPKPEVEEGEQSSRGQQNVRSSRLSDPRQSGISSGSKHYNTKSLRTDYYAQDDEDPLGEGTIPIVKGAGGSLAAAARKGRSRSRSHSFTEQVKALQNPTTAKHFNVPSGGGVSGGPGSGASTGNTPGILMNAPSSSGQKKQKPPHQRQRKGSVAMEHLDSDIVSPMTKIKTNESGNSENVVYTKRERRASRSSIDSDADSHASRSSQETEEDVCFPMLREHVRIKGIDFDEIEEFIKAEREEEEFMKEQQYMIAQKTALRFNGTGNQRGTNGGPPRPLTSAMKYTPKNILRRTTTGLSKITSRRTESESYHDPSIIGGASVPDVGSPYPPLEKTSDSSTIQDESPDEKAHNSINFHGHEDDSSSENVKFGGTRVNDGSSSLPDRFSFFSSESDETIHAPDIPSLVGPNQSVRELFHSGEGTWWLDCSCPTDAEMKMIAKAFGIHPLTAEDIRMQETREKVELFRSYYFVCFHTFEPDKESEEYLEPINVYIVVFRDGILSFHFSPILHPANVRRRVRQLRDYVDVSADWLCYALIDDITDGFAPVITGIEYEADAIEDSVFVARELDFSNMLRRIGESRRKVMTLMRLLSGKADVIKMFAKRCQDEAVQSSTIYGSASHSNLSNMDGMGGHSLVPHYPNSGPPVVGAGVSFGPTRSTGGLNFHQSTYSHPISRAQPRADIALYLGDIQDHVVTMFQNLLAYEKIFSRSHANYLAQLQVESFNSNNKVTQMLSKVTLIGTMIVPLNVITGLFGMNVKVPGQDGSDLKWFFGIVGVMVFLVIMSLFFAKFWLRDLDTPPPRPGSSSRSIKSLGLRTRTKEAAKSIISFPNKYD